MRTTVLIFGLLTVAGCCSPSLDDSVDVSYRLDVDIREVPATSLDGVEVGEEPFYRADITIIRVGPDGSEQKWSGQSVVCQRGKPASVVVSDGRRLEGQPELPSDGVRIDVLVGGKEHPDRGVVDVALTEDGSTVWQKTLSVPIVAL